MPISKNLESPSEYIYVGDHFSPNRNQRFTMAAMATTPMNTTLRLAVSQSHTLSTTAETLEALMKTAHLASQQSVDLILFPEAYLGGYPRGATFGAAVGTRDDRGKEQFLRYFKDSVDLGDTPAGDGEKWIRKERRDWVGNLRGDGEQEKIIRGDGTREILEKVARETGVFLVVGLVERAGGTLYCAVVYVCPRLGGELVPIRLENWGLIST